jgi:hypothetical protein
MKSSQQPRVYTSVPAQNTQDNSGVETVTDDSHMVSSSASISKRNEPEKSPAVEARPVETPPVATAVLTTTTSNDAPAVVFKKNPIVNDSGTSIHSSQGATLMKAETLSSGAAPTDNSINTIVPSPSALKLVFGGGIFS